MNVWSCAFIYHGRTYTYIQLDPTESWMHLVYLYGVRCAVYVVAVLDAAFTEACRSGTCGWLWTSFNANVSGLL